VTGTEKPLFEEKNMSTSTTLRDTWGMIKASLKERYAELTDNDLAYIQGEEDAIIDRIQSKTGASRDDILRIVNATQEQPG
jgi:uncharacterized protein YjbJ (UPF0337 family)